jgi:hypothetical protein
MSIQRFPGWCKSWSISNTAIHRVLNIYDKLYEAADFNSKSLLELLKKKIPADQRGVD